MRNILINNKYSLTTIICFLHLCLFAQNPLFPGIKNLNRKVIVKDSSGKIYSSNEWLPLTTKYEYKFNRIDSTGEVLVYNLVKMTDSERAEILSNIEPEETHNFNTGKKLSPFDLEDVQKNQFKLDNLKGKIVVLYFCILESPATKYEASELNTLAEKFRDSANIVFIAITEEDRSTAKNFIKKTGFKFHVVPNAKSTMEQYDIYSWPTHVVIDRNGIVRLHNMTYNPVLSVFWVNKLIDDIIAENKK
jgi:peroxiredoxin